MDEFAKDRMRIKEGLAPVSCDPADGMRSDEDIASKQKEALISNSTTALSPSLDLKQGNTPNIAASSSQ